MNTNHIAILLEVESCRSISKAAQNLYMSQPQVSNIIRNLEEENGFPIFVRTRSGVSLTPQGKLFLESLHAIQTEMEKISRIPEHFQEKKDLSIAAIYSRFLFQAFLRFRELFPERGVTDYFMEEMNDSVIDRVVSRQVRIGILSRTPNLPGHLGNLIERYNLDYQVRSVYLFLIKMNDMQQVQRAIMAFLKRLNSMYETTLKDELRQLYRRLKPLEHHPYERRTFYYLDILSWLESKLKGVPVAEVIRQRFLQQNGR